MTAGYGEFAGEAKSLVCSPGVRVFVVAVHSSGSGSREGGAGGVATVLVR